jgi:hypothetical protein
VAVRNGYLNFYLRGQSVAHVACTREGVPFARTHVKYAAPEEDERRQEYVKLVDGELWCSGRKTGWRYEGGTTLDRWIERADKWGRGKARVAEKTFVDDVVSDNSGVIDLEMGLPAWIGCKTAKRMDLVALESTEDRLRIAFWEAKTISDPRLVSTAIPEVKDQLDSYSAYLRDPERRNKVSRAYRQTVISCSVFTAWQGKYALI